VRLLRLEDGDKVAAAAGILEEVPNGDKENGDKEGGEKGPAKS
jgi:hypothetical protein